MDRGDFLEKEKMEKAKICKKDKWKLAALVFGVVLLVSLVLYGQEGKEKYIAKKDKNEPAAETGLDAPKNIRVLLKNSDYGSIYHPEVIVSSDKVLKITEGEEVKQVATGEAFSLKWEKETEGNTVEKNEEVAGEAGSNTNKLLLEGGKLSVASISRGQSMPVYEGKLEIYSTDQGYVLVNEVDFETYVKGVIPGEMPASYEEEALKAQAVCARTYAYMKLKGEESYPEYGANLDDSVQYQVYKSQQGNERTDRAVEETKGEILTYQGGIAATYYFSTSWGYTTGMDAWLKEDIPYLTTVAIGEAEELSDFEEAFRNPKGTFYEETEPWYRWQLVIDCTKNKETLFNHLTEKKKENPGAVLIWKEEDKAYVEGTPETIDQIRNMEVTKRGSGGVACTLEITTDKQKIQVSGQHTIRQLLAFPDNQIVRQDGSVIKNFGLLPSGFFILEMEKEEEAVKNLKLTGGGFGHGAGMSQNGANQMAKLGRNYQEILSFFYQDTEIGCLQD